MGGGEEGRKGSGGGCEEAEDGKGELHAECREAGKLCEKCVMALMPGSHPDTPLDELATRGMGTGPVGTGSSSASSSGTAAAKEAKGRGLASRAGLLRSLSQDDRLWVERQGLGRREREARPEPELSAAEELRIRELTLAFLQARARLSAALRHSLRRAQTNAQTAARAAGAGAGTAGPTGAASPVSSLSQSLSGAPSSQNLAEPLASQIPPGHQLVLYRIRMGGGLEDRSGTSSPVSALSSATVLHPAHIGRLHISLPHRPSRVFLDEQHVYPEPF